MVIFKFLGLFGIFSIVLCDQRLLIDQLRWDFLEMENELWNLSSNGILYKEQEESELYLVKRFYDFDQKLKQMPEDILRGTEPLRTIPNFLFLFSELKTIENKYEKFREYQSAHISKSKNKVALEDIIYDIINNKTGVDKTTDRIYDLSFDGQGNIRGELLEQIIKDNFWCKNFQQSPQQLFYNLYNVVSLFELKAYILKQFAYLGNRLWEKGNNVQLSILTRKNYEKRIKRTNVILRTVKNYPKDIWICDPRVYIKGKTYDEFTRLLQGHIQNEVDMNSMGTCTDTCSEHSYTKSYGCYDYESEFCRKVERCDGKIIGCYYVEGYASICLSSSPSRRYDYVKYDSGRILGKKRTCAYQRSVNSWSRWFVSCDYCMCLCDQQESSDRYINLRPVMADIKNNRVVTGLRLVKHNRILHLQIQEGKLLPYGYIIESTVHWVPVDNYKITDRGVNKDKDFFMLTYGDRSMALDEIQVNEDNYVITGVRFAVIWGRVQFKIYVSPFNWHNGIVQQNNGYYIYETNPNGRSKIPLSNADVPILTSTPSQLHFSGAKSYVEFTHTDFDKDVAQTTIPFIDTQEVVNKPAVPLMGAGIYYKGTAGYGGFIAPRIKTYDFGKHISSLVPNMGDRRDEDFSVEVN